MVTGTGPGTGPGTGAALLMESPMSIESPRTKRREAFEESLYNIM